MLLSRLNKSSLLFIISIKLNNKLNLPRTMTLKVYHPIPRFPPISISGFSCTLQCKHCSGLYLKGMQSADTPEKLMRACQELDKNNAVGTLVSGGSDNSGRMLNLTRMLGALRKVKEETNLIINIHPGLITKEIAREMAVDFASLEIPSDAVIKKVFNLDVRHQDYVETYHNLSDAGITVVPHICIYTGEESELLEDITGPSVIVVIVFTPTRNTPMSAEKSPDVKDIGRVITNIHQMFPDTEISLGCMRPRSVMVRDEIEIEALKAGVSRMEMPSKNTIRYAMNLGYEIKKFDACCALPERYERFASSGLV